MKTMPYARFAQRTQQAAHANNVLWRAMFELTYECNFACRHCYVPAAYRRAYAGKQLSTAGVFSVLRQLKKEGCLYVGFTGGEPFMRRDILKILSFAAHCGFEIMVYTNGSLITKPIAVELGRLRLNKIDITLPALSETAFGRVTGKSASRDAVLRAVDLLHEQGIPLGFKSSLLRDNQREIAGIQEFARNLGSRHRLDDLLFPRLDGSTIPYRFRGSGGTAPAGKKTNTVVRKKRLRNAAAVPQQSSHVDLFPCGAGKTQAAITPAGELKMCVMIDAPRYLIPETSLPECWGKLKLFARQVTPDSRYACGDCELSAHCCWCPGRAWLKNHSYTACDLECKRWAQAKHEEACLC